VYTHLNKSLDKVDELYEDMQQYRETQTYLRDYAFTNTHEFFAVCVEHFFETPLHFYQKYPDLFKDLCNVLNQNPLNTKNDYALTL
jgi:Mlc titration factor MtfA (ptsG expression regulator)